jgi:hypothetical protein
MVYNKYYMDRDVDTLETYSRWKKDPTFDFLGIDENWISEKEEWLAEIRKKTDNVTISPDWAKGQADIVLKDLGIEGMAVAELSAVVQFCTDKYRQFMLNKMSFNPDESKGGYELVYMRDLGGLTASLLVNGYAEGKAGSVLAEDGWFPGRPPFMPEMIRIFVTDEGVQSFEWENMSQPVRIVAENTMLLPFDEITERFADFLNFFTFPETRRKIDVSSVGLHAANSPAYGAPERAWLVPVWVFEYDMFRMHGEEPEYEQKAEIRFSAIDGGMISPEGGGTSVIQ